MEPLDIVRKYYPESLDAYRILMTHNRSVVDKALALACLHPGMNLGLTFVEEVTMLYDIGILLCNALDINRHGEADYICHGYLGADLIWKKGYPRRALICERHTKAGLSLIVIEGRSLPVPHRDMRPVSLEGQLICFVDRFFSKAKLTKKKPADRIKQSLSKYGNETVEQLEHWYKLFLGE